MQISIEFRDYTWIETAESVCDWTNVAAYAAVHAPLNSECITVFV